MLGVLIGAVGAMCLVKAFRRFRYRRFARFGGPFGYGMAYGGGCGGGGGWGGPGGGHAYRSRYIDDDEPSWQGRGPWEGQGYGGYGDRGDGRDGFFLGALLARIDATPEQSKVIRDAVQELRTKARSVKDDVKGVRKDLANAMRGETLDVDMLGTVASKAGDGVDTMRDAAIGALLKVHQVLEPRQRAIVADALESRFGGFRGFRRGF